ncbi:MAG: hypothetical protein V1676_03755 [Candidatus Diapherotrites archaeon]
MAGKGALLFVAVIAVCLAGAAGIVATSTSIPGFGSGEWQGPGTQPGGGIDIGGGDIGNIGDDIITGDTIQNGGPSVCKWGTLCICDSVDTSGNTLTCIISKDATIYDEDPDCDITKKESCSANIKTFWQLRSANYASYTHVVWKFVNTKSTEFKIKSPAYGETFAGKIFGSGGVKFDIEMNNAGIFTNGNFSITGASNITLENGSDISAFGGGLTPNFVEMESIGGDLKLTGGSAIRRSFRGKGGTFSANNIIVEDSAIASEASVVKGAGGKIDGIIKANNLMRLKNEHCGTGYSPQDCEDPLGAGNPDVGFTKLNTFEFLSYDPYVPHNAQKLNYRIEAGRLEMQNTNLKIAYNGEEIHAGELDMTDSRIECIGQESLIDDPAEKNPIAYDCTMSVTGNAAIKGRHSNRKIAYPSDIELPKRSIDGFKTINVSGNLALSSEAYIYNLGKIDDCWSQPKQSSKIGNTPLQEKALTVGGALTMNGSRIDGWANVGISAGSAKLEGILWNAYRNDDLYNDSLNKFTMFPYGSTDGVPNNDYDDEATLWNIAKFKVGNGFADKLDISGGAKLMRLGYIGVKAVEVAGEFATDSSTTHCETGCEISACSASAKGTPSKFEAWSGKGGQSLALTTCPAASDDDGSGKKYNVSAGALTVKCETGNEQCIENINWNGTPKIEKNTDCGKCESKDFKCIKPMTANPASQADTGKFPTDIKAQYTSPIGANNISIDCSTDAENRFPPVTKSGNTATAQCIFKALGNPGYAVHKVSENYCGTIDVPHGTPYCYDITANPNSEPDFSKGFPSTVKVFFKGKPTSAVTVDCNNGTKWTVTADKIKDGPLAGGTPEYYYAEGVCTYAPIMNYDCVKNFYDNMKYNIKASGVSQSSSCIEQVQHGTCLDTCHLEPKEVKKYSGAAFTQNFTYVLENTKSNFEGAEVEVSCGNGKPAYKNGNPSDQKITISGGKAEFTCAYDKCDNKLKVCVYGVTAAIKKSGVSDYCHAGATVSYGEPGCIFGPYDPLTGQPAGWSSNDGTPAYVLFYMSDKYAEGDKVSLWCKGTDNPESKDAYLKKNAPSYDWGYVQWYVKGSTTNNCDPCKKDTTLRAMYDNKGMAFDCTALCQNTTAPQPECGNGTKEGEEECDAPDLDNKQCSDFTDSKGNQYKYGELKCTSGCEFDTSGCGYCGDGDIDLPYEQCDGGGCGAGETCSDSCFCTGGGGTDEDVSIRILSANPPGVIQGRSVVISAGIENSYSESKTLDVKFEIKNTSNPGFKEKTCYEQVTIGPGTGQSVTHSFGGSGGFGIMRCGDDVYFDNIGDRYRAIVSIEGIEPPEADDDTSDNYKDDAYFEIVRGITPPSETLEDCFNGEDDDGDGLIDCMDKDCPCPSGETCNPTTYKCEATGTPGRCGDGNFDPSTEQCDESAGVGDDYCVSQHGGEAGWTCQNCICVPPGGGGTGGGFIPELPIFFVPAMLGAVLAIIFLSRRK